MESQKTSTSILIKLVDASAGSYNQYQIAFWAQLVLGFLYSFGFFDSRIAGFVLGFFMPSLWVILTYRYAFLKAKENVQLPFPDWMQKNPGNTLVIVIDIAFLAMIWTIILTGLYEPRWIKVIFTMIFPILTLSMLRNLVIYPFPKNDDAPQTEQDRKNSNESD
ncbi:MAG: hypothetical protein K0B37_05175 [Bacteroidales bacterium]|nr:hypothetical protein [Bacteroidales bacterium]